MPLMANWVWPIEAHKGRRPSISDGFGHHKRGGSGHLGADVMFWSEVELKPNPPENSKRFYVPAGHPALCVGPGTVSKVFQGSRGWQVTIDHHMVPGVGPVATFYSHLASVAVGLKKGDSVHPGSYLGTVGDDPKNPGDPRHMHFEIWITDRGASRAQWAVDPAPFLRGWQVKHGAILLAAKGAVSVPSRVASVGGAVLGAEMAAGIIV